MNDSDPAEGGIKWILHMEGWSRSLRKEGGIGSCRGRDEANLAGGRMERDGETLLGTCSDSHQIVGAEDLMGKGSDGHGGGRA